MPTTMPALVAFHAVFYELPGCLGTARRFCELYDTWLAQGTEFCAACRTQHHLKTCSKCKAVYYCGVECQREDWVKQHRRECEVLKVDDTDGRLNARNH
ncbi:hypothetical protein R3P38DRAFT_1816989 [Favolaschia claudopus]|uniref:MYND-type domain-containing protein n=1 Tax=Favolaschia claudopus TaxID=2862362 RepID=A0AAW0A489_9AGAR